MKPIAKKPGVLKSIDPPHKVASQLIFKIVRK